MKSQVFVIVIITISAAVITGTCYGQGIPKTSSRSEIQCGCLTTIENETGNVNLGQIYSGSVTNNLPSTGGNGNRITFLLTGSAFKRYSIISSMDLTASGSSGAVVIDHWKWVTLLGYERTVIRDNQLSINCLKLFRPPGAGECDAYARFRIVVKQITAKPVVNPGFYTFTINLTVIPHI